MSEVDEFVDQIPEVGTKRIRIERSNGSAWWVAYRRKGDRYASRVSQYDSWVDLGGRDNCVRSVTNVMKLRDRDG